jgi:uncharacterized membrane protein
MRGKGHTRNSEPAAWNATMTRMAFMFVMAGLVGWAYEVFICGPLNDIGIDLGHGGLGIPFLTIYAVGALFIELVLGLGRQHHPLLQLVGSALLCTLLEYASGLAMLHVLGIRTWDYRIPGWDFLVSPDGLVCLRASLTFGLMGLVQLRGLNGLYRKLADKHPRGLAAFIWLLVAVVALALLNASLFHVADTSGMWH